MKKTFVLVSMLVAISMAAWSQDAETPTTVWGTPDLNGIWDWLKPLPGDALTTIERTSFREDGSLRYVLTIDDPKIFTEAWSQEFSIAPMPEWELMGLLE